MTGRLTAIFAFVSLSLGGLTAGGIAGATSALAYTGCASTSSASAASTVATANQPIEITVTLRECNGNAIVGAQVQFGQQSGPSGSSAAAPQAAPAQALNGESIQLVSAVQLTSAAGCQASFSPPTAVTDSNGVARSTATLPPGCPCQYVLSATGAGVTLTTTVREQGCLPFTTGARAVVPAGPTVPVGAALVLAGLALLAGAGTYLRVRRRI